MSEESPFIYKAIRSIWEREKKKEWLRWKVIVNQILDVIFRLYFRENGQKESRDDGEKILVTIDTLLPNVFLTHTHTRERERVVDSFILLFKRISIDERFIFIHSRWLTR